ncbi:unnamed protein product, partial [Closterium sp. NIES-54]
VVAVGASHDTPCTPFFEGSSPSPLAPSYASAAAVDILGADDVRAASALSGKRCSSKGKGGRSGGGGSGGGGGGASGGGGGGRGGGNDGGGGGGGSGGSGGGSGGFGGGGGGSGGGGGGGGSGSRGDGSGCGRGRAVQRGGSGGGQGQQQQRRSETPSPQQLQAAALGAIESALPGAAPAEALHNFTHDSGASRYFFRDSLHLPTFSTNLVSTAALQDSMVTTTTPGGQRVLIRTCTRTGRHLATFTRRPGSSLYTLATEPPQVAASLPPLPPLLSPPCLPCVEGRQRAAPHSSSFPPTTAPLQTLHMDVWGPARVRGQDREHYFLLVVDDYTRYTTVFPLRSNGERFHEDLPILRLHSERGGEFSSDLLRDFCRGEGILQSFTLPASLQQNGIAERRIGLVMEVARTSMIHAAAPHFSVAVCETSPTLRWTGQVGDASVFQVWGALSLVRDTTASKLSPRTLRCVFLGFPTDAYIALDEEGWRCVGVPGRPTPRDYACRGTAFGGASGIPVQGGVRSPLVIRD